MDPCEPADFEIIHDDEDPFAADYEEDAQFREFCDAQLGQEIIDAPMPEDYTYCCGAEMNPHDDGSIICSTCGCIKQFHGERDIDHTKSIAPPLQITGSRAYAYKRLLHTGDREGYKQLRDKYIADILKRIDNSAQNKLPLNVTYEAKLMCVAIMERRTYRTKVLREIIAACIYQACIKAHVYRRIKDIAAYVCLQKDGFPVGQAVLNEMADKGVIKIKVNIDPSQPLILEAFRKLDIDNKHVKFAKSIVKHTITKKIAINSMIYSRIIGVVALTVEAYNISNIKLEDIERKCNISRATILRFIREIKTHFSHFTSIYFKYDAGIPRDVLAQFRDPELRRKFWELETQKAGGKFLMRVEPAFEIHEKDLC